MGRSHSTSCSRLCWTWYKHSSVPSVPSSYGKTATKSSSLVCRLDLPPSSSGRRFNVMTMAGQDEEMTLLRTGTFAFLVCAYVCFLLCRFIFVFLWWLYYNGFLYEFCILCNFILPVATVMKIHNINRWRGKNNWSVFEKHYHILMFHNVQTILTFAPMQLIYNCNTRQFISIILKTT